jgi:hypothetical protein
MVVRKFRKAHLWSKKFMRVCKGRTDHVTESESEAYSHYL